MRIYYLFNILQGKQTDADLPGTEIVSICLIKLYFPHRRGTFYRYPLPANQKQVLKKILTVYVVVFSGGPVFFFSAKLLLDPSRSAIREKIDQGQCQLNFSNVTTIKCG